MDTQKVEQLLALIANKSKSQTDFDNTWRLVMEMIDNPWAIVNVDINDMFDLFQEGGVIHAFDVSIDASKENRMTLMMAQIMRNTKHFEPYSHAMVFFFFPEDHPLLMDELRPFGDWIESAPVELMIKWGMATQTTQELRVIVLLQ